jgi:hypothetical protein
MSDPTLEEIEEELEEMTLAQLQEIEKTLSSVNMSHPCRDAHEANISWYLRLEEWYLATRHNWEEIGVYVIPNEGWTDINWCRKCGGLSVTEKEIGGSGERTYFKFPTEDAVFDEEGLCE